MCHTPQPWPGYNWLCSWIKSLFAWPHRIGGLARPDYTFITTTSENYKASRLYKHSSLDNLSHLSLCCCRIVTEGEKLEHITLIWTSSLLVASCRYFLTDLYTLYSICLKKRGILEVFSHHLYMKVYWNDMLSRGGVDSCSSCSNKGKQGNRQRVWGDKCKNKDKQEGKTHLYRLGYRWEWSVVFVSELKIRLNPACSHLPAETPNPLASTSNVLISTTSI